MVILTGDHAILGHTTYGTKALNLNHVHLLQRLQFASLDTSFIPLYNFEKLIEWKKSYQEDPRSMNQSQCHTHYSDLFCFLLISQVCRWISNSSHLSGVDLSLQQMSYCAGLPGPGQLRPSRSRHQEISSSLPQSE